MKNNFLNNRLIYFSADAPDHTPGNDLADKFSQKEAEILASKQNPEDPNENAVSLPDLIDENRVQTELQNTAKKIEDSKVDGHHKDDLQQKLKDLTENRKKQLEQIGHDQDIQLQDLHEKTVKDLEQFTEQPDVKDILEVLGPLFQNSAAVKNAINYKTYKKNTNAWVKINEGLIKASGVQGYDIKKLQKLLGVDDDDKVGPITMNAIAKLLGFTDINVKPGDQTEYNGSAIDPAPAEPETTTGDGESQLAMQQTLAGPTPPEPQASQAQEDGTNPAPNMSVESPPTLQDNPETTVPDAGTTPTAETEVKTSIENELPSNLKNKNFYKDKDGNIRRDGYKGTFTLNEGALSYKGTDYGIQYLKPGGNIDTDWQSANLTLDPKYPENLTNKDFFEDHSGQLRRKGYEGIYVVNEDKSITYRGPEGLKMLDAGKNPNYGWKDIVDTNLQSELPGNLQNKGFFKDQDGNLRRKDNDGIYTINGDGSIQYQGSEHKGILKPNGDINKNEDWAFSERPLSFEEHQRIETQQEEVHPGGFARLYEESESQQILNQYSMQQKVEMLKSLTEEAPEALRIKKFQVGMIRTMLETIVFDLRGENKDQKWDTYIDQVFEIDSETGRKISAVNQHIKALEKVEFQLEQNPNLNVNDLITPELKSWLQYYANGDNTLYNKTVGLLEPQNNIGRLIGEHNPENFLAGFMDKKGNVLAANSLEELKKQQLALIKFLRENKDYPTAQKLIEEVLLGPEFEKERNKLLEYTKQQIRIKARGKVNISSDQLQEWTNSGMDEATQDAYRNELVNIEEKRLLNELIAEMNNGLPFEVNGTDKEIMAVYKDMMGTGEWHNFSDATWDKITEELIINAPMIVGAGIVAQVGRRVLSAGARSVVGSSRLSRLGLTLSKGAVKAKGLLGNTLLWSGKTAGLLAEGTLFELTHSALQGQNLFEGGLENWPEWGKRILWSSATLGAFHISAGKAKQITDKLSSVIKGSNKIPADIAKVMDAAQKLVIAGNIEAGTMLSVGVAQRLYETGNLEDFHLVEELLHAYMSVGALKVSGKGVAVGKKLYFPETQKATGNRDVIKPEKFGEKTVENKDQKSGKEKAKQLPKGKEKESERIFKEKNFEVGDEIFTRRNDGSKDSGWRITKILVSGEVIVSKKINGNLSMSKELTKHQIIELNSEGPFKKADKTKSKEAKKGQDKQKGSEETTMEKEAKEKARKEAEQQESVRKFEEATRIFKEKNFEVGDEIFVERSNGIKESGWRIMGIYPNGAVIVTKNIAGGQTMSKTLSKSEIIELNSNGPSKKAEEFKKEEERKKEEEARKEKERRANEFKVGDEVLIGRSDGRIHHAKIVFSYQGEYTVEWHENGSTYNKRVTYDQLKDWQNQGPKQQRSKPRDSYSNPEIEILFENGKLKEMSELYKLDLKDFSEFANLARNPDIALKIFGFRNISEVTEVSLRSKSRILSKKYHPDKYSIENPEYLEHANIVAQIITIAKATLKRVQQRKAA